MRIHATKRQHTGWRSAVPDALVITGVSIVETGPLNALTTDPGIQLHANIVFVEGTNPNALPDYSQLVWSTTDGAIATVDSSGNLTWIGGGQATITVTYPGPNVLATIVVNVTAPINVVQSVTVTPAGPVSGFASGQIVLTAQAKDVSNNPVSGQTYTAVSSNTNVLTVAVAGQFLTVTYAGTGTATITATCNGVDSTAVTFNISSAPAGVLYGSWHADSLALGQVGAAAPPGGAPPDNSLGIAGFSARYGNKVYSDPITITDQAHEGVAAFAGNTRYARIGVTGFLGTSGLSELRIRPQLVGNGLSAITNPAYSLSDGIYFRYRIYVPVASANTVNTLGRQFKTHIYRLGDFHPVSPEVTWDVHGVGAAFSGANFALNINNNTIRFQNGINQGGVLGGANWGNGQCFNSGAQAGGMGQWIDVQFRHKSYADVSTPFGVASDSDHWINEVLVHSFRGQYGTPNGSQPVQLKTPPYYYGGGDGTTPPGAQGARFGMPVIESGSVAMSVVCYISNIAVANRFITSGE